VGHRFIQGTETPELQGCSDGGYMGMTSKRLLNMSIKFYSSPKNSIPPKQISGYVPAELPGICSPGEHSSNQARVGTCHPTWATVGLRICRNEKFFGGGGWGCVGVGWGCVYQLRIVYLVSLAATPDPLS